jgi:hypothetical protein
MVLHNAGGRIIYCGTHSENLGRRASPKRLFVAGVSSTGGMDLAPQGELAGVSRWLVTHLAASGNAQPGPGLAHPGRGFPGSC